MESPGLTAVGADLVSAVGSYGVTLMQGLPESFPALGAEEDVERVAVAVGDAEE
tara:strand:- start:164 stop:325 length:162 start_codon:yes stop_codon:yes gene_type:complete